MPQLKLKRLHGIQRILDADSPYSGPYAEDIAELRAQMALLLQLTQVVAAEAEAGEASVLLVGVVQGMNLLLEAGGLAAMQVYRAAGAPFGDNHDGMKRWVHQRSAGREA
jgi:hypothetical protein